MNQDTVTREFVGGSMHGCLRKMEAWVRDVKRVPAMVLDEHGRAVRDVTFQEETYNLEAVGDLGYMFVLSGVSDTDIQECLGAFRL